MGGNREETGGGGVGGTGMMLGGTGIGAGEILGGTGNTRRELGMN